MVPPEAEGVLGVGGSGVAAAVIVGVVTTAVGVILRRAALPVSATKRFPVASIFTSRGWFSHASMLVPSLNPATVERPATVVTTPEAVIFLMAEFAVSAT